MTISEKKPTFEVVDKENIEKKSNEQNKEKLTTIEKLQSKEEIIEYYFFKTRWVLSIMYFALIIVLILLLGKFIWEIGTFIFVMFSLNTNQWIVHILELLDLTLVANLILIVAFSGYENFVSDIDITKDKQNRLPWMGQLDFSGLKIKIIGSVVAISLIELLQDFLNASSHVDPNFEFWRIVLHLTFVMTGLVFAAMEVLTQKRHGMKSEEELNKYLNKL